MTPAPHAGVEAALLALPTGVFRGQTGNRRYVVSKTLFNAGKSIKLVAEELGGDDYISLNFYRLNRGARLYPCEMSAKKVTDFVMTLKPEPAQDDA
ncbi:hypothetical protein [uncultured Roseobacter sp.]|uniref:hypothetical protein n=1 Tax=uncultured Roseobacter sp. TaxID=114847 RepID=UPI002613A7FE|nr:hypothetical protein [uncultured Roseobacter sp.]